MDNTVRILLEILLESAALKFGDFELKSGQRSPVFIDIGKALSPASRCEKLGACYAGALLAFRLHLSELVLCGIPTKGVPIANSLAQALLNEYDFDLEVVFIRGEAKGHGEGGQFFGTPVEGRNVLLVDDVLTAGTAIREAARIVTNLGGNIAGILVGIDRQQISLSNRDATAAQVISMEFSAPLISVAAMCDVIQIANERGEYGEYLPRLEAYCRESCIFS